MKRGHVLSVLLVAFALVGGSVAAVGVGASSAAPAAGGARSVAPVTVAAATPVESYVSQVYLDLLGRPVEPGGLSYWSSVLNAGVPRPAVAWALVNSNEYRGRVIAEMYHEYLERGTDAGGLAYWVGQVAAGMTFEQFQSLLMGSDEYYLNPRKGNNNPNAFVNSMYADLLGRIVDPGGEQFFVGQLRSGVPRSQVVAGIVYSSEHLATTVNGYYRHFLGRDADLGGKVYWASQLMAGSRDEVVVALIIGSDEYWNRAQGGGPPPPALPDLVATDFSWTPTNPKSGDAVTFAVTVKNQGAGPTPPGVKVGVGFYLDSSPTAINWVGLYIPAGGLGAGASVQLVADGGPTGSASWLAVAGTHQIGASVDDVNRITESNESNNGLLRSITVAPPPAKPDLTVTDVSWTPASPTAGSAVTFSAVVKNAGNAPTPPGVVIGVGFTVDPTATTPTTTWSNTYATSLQPAASVTLTANSGVTGAPTWPAVVGSHTIRAWVDDVNRITESNESNNQFTETITVAAPWPDLVVTDLSWQPTTVWAGDQVLFSVVVRNVGAAATPAGTVLGVGFYVDGASTPITFSDTETASLAPGASVILAATAGPPDPNSFWDFPGPATWTSTPGTHTVTAWVDDVNRIQESNETNNKVTRSISVQGACSTPSGAPASFKVVDSTDEGGSGMLVLQKVYPNCYNNYTSAIIGPFPGTWDSTSTSQLPTTETYVGTVWELRRYIPVHDTYLIGAFVKEFVVTQPGMVVTVP